MFNFQGLFSRITFAQPVQLGGTSLFLNSEHFLETNKSYQGCIRNLEINNKAYNLNPTDFGGDILSGVDIGKYKHFQINKYFYDPLNNEIVHLEKKKSS